MPLIIERWKGQGEPGQDAVEIWTANLPMVSGSYANPNQEELRLELGQMRSDRVTRGIVLQGQALHVSDTEGGRLLVAHIKQDGTARRPLDNGDNYLLLIHRRNLEDSDLEEYLRRLHLGQYKPDNYLEYLRYIGIEVGTSNSPAKK